ncbi:MAG TPA: hypothetical protein VMZ73_06585 [Acidimicrobiales bacterium]|nr:hypothetical protein [Acidimicrobiales bacterium]
MTTHLVAALAVLAIAWVLSGLFAVNPAAAAGIAGTTVGGAIGSTRWRAGRCARARS